VATAASFMPHPLGRFTGILCHRSTHVFGLLRDGLTVRPFDLTDDIRNIYLDEVRTTTKG
jgi:hypothetical protein